MLIEQFVDIGRFSSYLDSSGKEFLFRWKSTALEIEIDRYQEIARLFEIYNEIPESELLLNQKISFVDGLLRLLEDESKQRSLLQIEALPFLTNTK